MDIVISIIVAAVIIIWNYRISKLSKVSPWEMIAYIAFLVAIIYGSGYWYMAYVLKGI